MSQAATCRSTLVLASGLAAAMAWLPVPTQAQPGDVFSSGSPPNPYGGGNTTRRTGKQANQDDSVYCQQTPDGQVIPKPYGGTRRNIPCGPNFVQRPVAPPPPQPVPKTACSCEAPSAPAGKASNVQQTVASLPRDRREVACLPCPSQQAVRPVFNYYYINGINTPYEDPQWRPEWRGNYEWDWLLIRGNLVGLGPTVPAGERNSKDLKPPVKVADEEDVMDENEKTYNKSGTQRGQFCADFAHGRLPGDPGQQYVYELLCKVDEFRGGKFTGSLSPGDLLESFYQSRFNKLDYAALQPEVALVAASLLATYRTELKAPAAQRRTQFFVLIAHSQGNFLGEGLAYRLANYEGEDGKALYRQRLAIISIASPTSYESLPGDFVTKRLRHLTRADDAILALRSNPIPGAKKPFRANLVQLWPWKDGELAKSNVLFEPRWNFPVPLGSPLIDLMGLGPTKTCEPEKYEKATVCDPGLYAPRMNSHLLENYLIDPPLTRPGKPIHPAVGKMLVGNPTSSPVVPSSSYGLAYSRSKLVELKTSLLNGMRAAPVQTAAKK